MKEYQTEKYKDAHIEQLDSEIIDNESSSASYEVLTYPTDYTLEGLVAKYEKKKIRIPGFQRNYVWTISQASKLIESFLLGLPVPAVFLYTDEDETLNVIDGQQRLLSIVYYFSGYFGEETKGKKTVFKLTGLNEKSPFANATIEILESKNLSSYNKLCDSVLRAFIVKQIHPKDNTSIYHIFERLNTGGTQLQGQEIRNCVYHGTFNDFLNKLNLDKNWRKIFGSTQPNKRKRDVELILRFLALLNDRNKYEKPMKDFLSKFMAKNKNLKDDKLKEFENIFRKTSDLIINQLGQKPFNISRGINVAVFDSVFTVIAENINSIDRRLSDKFTKLKNDSGFLKNISSATTDEAAVKARYDICKRILVG
jgi:hypothetical protein